ncbi:MAG: hypothetical protein ACTSSH_09675 [Candidatus Heimdallarchaeota archaeon]
MAILESGIVVNGLPLIRSEYYPSEFYVDPFIKTSLVTAIQSFASEAFNDEVEEIQLKNFSIMIQDLDPGTQEPLLLYCIVEKGTDTVEVKKRLVSIEKKIDLIRIMVDTPVMTKDLKKIKKTIDEELKDLCLKPADRAKNVFG